MRPPKRDGAAFSCDAADLAKPTVTLGEGGVSYAFVTQKLTGPDAPVGRPNRPARCSGCWLALVVLAGGLVLLDVALAESRELLAVNSWASKQQTLFG